MCQRGGRRLGSLQARPGYRRRRPRCRRLLRRAENLLGLLRLCANISQFLNPWLKLRMSPTSQGWRGGADTKERSGKKLRRVGAPRFTFSQWVCTGYHRVLCLALCPCAVHLQGCEVDPYGVGPWDERWKAHTMVTGMFATALWVICSLCPSGCIGDRRPAEED